MEVVKPVDLFGADEDREFRAFLYEHDREGDREVPELLGELIPGKGPWRDCAFF